MPVGNLMMVLKYMYTTPAGEVEPHLVYKRVNSGSEGIAVRDRLVTNGKGVDDRVMVVGCNFIALSEAAPSLGAAA